MEKDKTNQNNYIVPKNKSDLVARLGKGELALIEVKSNHLEDAGIYSRDAMIVHQTRKISEDQLTVWDVFDIEESVISGYAYDNFGDISILRPNGETVSRKKNELKLLGAVVGLLRDYQSPKQAVTPEIEITVICRDCGRTEKGSRKFLKAEGWCLKDKPRCVRCDVF